jgi:hypothetical protein
MRTLCLCSPETVSFYSLCFILCMCFIGSMYPLCEQAGNVFAMSVLPVLGLIYGLDISLG